ncbi:hypothetical protein [uncultured Propionivibrio sp.]|uniref:hypothetical protein n=1 Tax=uncultured Propionivibrio sp. TaxID=426737 RepID=UPI0029C0EF80|nr:hypothetical protein [uncultured Propionivibrio sp.]
MSTVKYYAPKGFLGKRSVGSLSELEGVLNVSTGNDGCSATISPLHVPSCEGVFCKIEALGYKARLP